MTNTKLQFSIAMLLVLFISDNALSQTYLISTQGTNNTCGGTFYDSGGAGGSHGGNENYTQTFCSDASNCISFNFSSFDLGNGDNLNIYDGPNTSSALIGTYTGTGSPGTITSTTGCLTFQFTSSPGNNGSGWAAAISCQSCSVPQTFNLNGDAQYITVNGEQCIQLTAALNDQTGCAWNDSPIDFANDFNLTLNYYFGSNINGADGNTFSFQPSASSACGTAGGQLGAGGLTNALAIEFDTYDNDNPTHLYDMLCDHIAIEIDGNHQNAAPAAGPVCAKTNMGNIDDGGTYEVEIAWNAATMTLDIYFDGVLRLSYTNDIVTNVFGGQNLVYWGATSATGGLNNQQYFCPSSIVILPVGLTSFTSECNGTDEIFSWTTSTEQNANYFTLEYTYDGYVFYPESVVQAVGNSSSEQSYRARISTIDKNNRFYRLKFTDMNGTYDVSELIASQRCLNTSELVQSLHQVATKLTINVNEPCQARIINMMGQKAYTETTIQGSETLQLSNLASGMYQLLIIGNTGKREIHQIMIP